MEGGGERKQSEERWRDKQRSSRAMDNDALRPAAKRNVSATGWKGGPDGKRVNLFEFVFINAQMSSHCAV